MTDAFSDTTNTDNNTETNTVEKRLADKDEFIERLKSELAALREEVKKQDEADKALSELKNEIKSLKEQSNQPKENTTPALTEVDIKTLVQQTITEQESRRTVSQNIQTANDTLVAKLGTVEKAAEAVKAKAQELGVSVDFLKDVAAKSPTAFLNVMGQTAEVKKADTSSSFVQGSVNTSALKETTVVAKEGTKAFFDNIRKTDPSRYWTPSTQNQIWKAIKAGTYIIE